MRERRGAGALAMCPVTSWWGGWGGWLGLGGLPWAGWLGGPTGEGMAGDICPKAPCARVLPEEVAAGTDAALGVTVIVVGGRGGQNRRRGRVEVWDPS